jgi:rRNA maturation protein Nop10
MSEAKHYEEGDTCPECGGTMELIFPAENCSCHLSAPCIACENNVPKCPDCGWSENE